MFFRHELILSSIPLCVGCLFATLSPGYANDKILALVRIAGVFTAPAAAGHTLTGSTVEFNGASAQQLPAGFPVYNNLILNNTAGTTGVAGLTVCCRSA